jgi:hypothetical protein
MKESCQEYMGGRQSQGEDERARHQAQGCLASALRLLRQHQTLYHTGHSAQHCASSHSMDSEAWKGGLMNRDIISSSPWAYSPSTLFVPSMASRLLVELLGPLLELLLACRLRQVVCVNGALSACQCPSSMLYPVQQRRCVSYRVGLVCVGRNGAAAGGLVVFLWCCVSKCAAPSCAWNVRCS